MYKTFKGYLITLDRHSWGYEGVAIPDHGDWIRQKFIGYTKKEMLETMKNLIKEKTT